MRSYIFRGARIHVAATDEVSSISCLKVKNWVKYGGGSIIDDLGDRSTTHVVIISDSEIGEMERAAEVRSFISTRTPVPRVVSRQWVEDCWKNRTILDEERYAPL